MLKIKNSASTGGAQVPEWCTTREGGLSSDFEVEGTDPNAKSIAITLDGASYSISSNYNYWAVWNLPVQTVILEGISHGGTVASFGDITQGITYSRNQYKGSKPSL